jgi:hypothetical protein
MKYTPGPWKFLDAFGRVETDSEIVAYIAGGVRPTRDIAIANGNLIAAAPELLEALATARFAIQVALDGGSVSEKNVRSTLDQIDAAIRKAKGEL